MIKGFKSKIQGRFTIAILFGLALLSTGLTAYYSYKLNTSLDDNMRVQDNRTKSIVLADELRQSSDDLTNFARLYAITEDTYYKDAYDQIIDIRNGVEPRPHGYEEIYWDLVNIGGAPDTILGEKIHIDTMMANLGMDETELAYMHTSKLHSDSLAVIERWVFDIIENSDDFRTKKLATERLFDEDYLILKAKIMLPIKNFYSHVDRRTMNNLSISIIKARYYLVITIVSAIITFLMIGLLRFAIYVSQKNNKVLLNSLNANNTAINKSNAVIEFCPNGVIINANENFLKIMGYDISELKGKHHSIFVNNDESSKEAYHEFWRDLSNGKFKTGEFTRYKKDGSIAYIQGTYNPIIKDGKVERILKIVTDVTAGILQREELDKKNTYLEHAAKIIRHDMHSGINTYIPRGIRSLKRRLSTILDDKETETIKSPMRMLTEGLSHTQKVYRSVYAFTNLVKKDASLEKESCSIKDILVDFLASTSYKTQVHIDENLPKDLNVNKWLFCTAMDNLVRNGLKYNDSPTKKVSIYYLDGNIVVEDNGRGMTQTDFNQLSQPYARKEGQVEGGTGLGLNICVAILEVHGFNISVLEDGAHVGTKILIEPKVVGE